MDGIKPFLRSDLEEADGLDAVHGLTLGPSIAPSTIPLPATQDEIEAILELVPRACRAHALWAVPLLLDTARAGGITHLRRIAYVLATAQHTSQFGAKLEEQESAMTATRGERSFDRYEPGTALGAALGNTERGDGERFRGRGFVHIRGRASYINWSRRLGLPDQLVDGAPVPYFVAHPAAMARPPIAAQTLVRGMRDGIFTGIALGSYVNDKKTDYHSARRVVDGPKHAREVADIAATFAQTLERLQLQQHHAHMQQMADLRATSAATRNFVHEICAAVERLALRGEVMPAPLQAVEWDGEARQGKFLQLDDRTCALHIGRGTYVRLDVQRDLNGLVPPEGRNMALKRSGDVRAAQRYGEVNSWR